MLGGLRRQFTLMTISGIPVRADIRWLAVILLISAVIAAGIVSLVGSWPAGFALGLSATLVFFVSIFTHEFAHAATARLEGLRVVEIVLHPFGGLTRFAHEPETPRAEFLIAIAGPAASFLLALLFVLAAAAASSVGTDILAILLFTLAIGNFLIAVFNILPGYPLDGGRVLRAYLWRSGKDLDEATVLTGRSGQVIAMVLVVFGLYVAVVRRDFFTGFWAMMVGIFLFDAAAGIIREVRAQRHLFVEDSMRLAVTVDPARTIREFVEEILPMHRQHLFTIGRERRLHGLLLLSDIKSIGREKWHSMTLASVMRPVSDELFVETGTSFSEAREICRHNGLGSVAVLDADGLLVGVFHGVAAR